MSSSSSIVISFSIVILLILILLLILSYNSKYKNTGVERFDTSTSATLNPIGSIMNSFNDMKQQIENSSKRMDNKMVQQPFTNMDTFVNSVATNDPYTMQSVYGNNNNSGGVNPAGGVQTFINYGNIDGSNGDCDKQYYSVENFTDGGNKPMTTDPSSCIVKEKLTAQDLLPKDATNLKWAQINPSSSGDISDQNFLTAGYHLGVNTVGQSLRNANLQLRSEIPNPQVSVSPWMISTIEPDVRSTTLEIGSAPSY
jgi:hypothetical protein